MRGHIKIAQKKTSRDQCVDPGKVNPAVVKYGSRPCNRHVRIGMFMVARGPPRLQEGAQKNILIICIRNYNKIEVYLFL